MEKSDREWFDDMVNQCAIGEPTVISQALASALHPFDHMIKYVSDRSVILENSKGNRVYIALNYGNDTGLPDSLVLIANFISDPEALFEDTYTEFSEAIEVLTKIL